jgi:hypothetical protein
MFRPGRGLVALGSAVAGSLAVAVGPAYARGGLQQCLDQAVDHNGEPPTCTKVNGTWVASWPDDTATSTLGGGIFGVFVVMAVVALLIAVGFLVWRVSTARKLAAQSGMDVGLATQMTLLTENGLDATYLASNLRQPQPAPTAPTPSPVPAPTATPKSAAERLTELAALRDQGMITPAEYDERRRSIIDAV